MAMTKLFDRCLIVDDDEDVRLSARLVLREMFKRVESAANPDEALASLDEALPDLVLLDANFARGATNGAEGFRLMGQILERDPAAAIVLITAHGGVQIAVEAMKRGATDFVSKPWNNERLLATARTAASLRRSRGGDTRPSSATETSLLGHSPAMARVHSLIAKAAPTDANVLILGENGTGKELVARELHRQSQRGAAPFLSVDLGAIAENLFDAELFGHVKGAFTDAKADRVGRMQAAAGGTLFLDEVGNLPLHLQPKLLTALEQRKITPVGGTAPVDIDVRIVAATNLPLDQLGNERRFRQDLLFRLNTVEIHLPPLRERPEDVPLLVDHFLRFYSLKYGKAPKVLPTEVLERLVAFPWPGNVRALRHAAERAVILSEGEAFALADFPVSPSSSEPASLSGSGETADLNLDRVERRLVEQALKMHGYNISGAAAELGLTRASLYRRMEKHGL